MELSIDLVHVLLQLLQQQGYCFSVVCRLLVAGCVFHGVSVCCLKSFALISPRCAQVTILACVAAIARTKNKDFSKST